MRMRLELQKYNGNNIIYRSIQEDDPSFLAQIKQYIRLNILLVQKYICNNEQEKSGISRMALEKIGHYTPLFAYFMMKRDGYDNKSISESDDDDKEKVTSTTENSTLF